MSRKTLKLCLAVFCTVLPCDLSRAAEQTPPEEPEWSPVPLEIKRCGSSDWAGRLGLQLGPQYYVQAEEGVQFSFAGEGHLRLAGPLSAGLHLGVGVIESTSLTAEAGLRIDIVRGCLLSLAADARGGVMFWPGAGRVVRGGGSAGLEVVHDLGDKFYIHVRASAGYLARDGWGWFLDLAVGVGFFFEGKAEK